jgi:type II secretory pathway pseudopilin PulG
LAEVVVVIAIIGMLMSLLLPALQCARESARQSRCQSNLRQLTLAIQSYEAIHGVYPPGRVGCDCATADICGFTPDSTRTSSSGFTQILPMLEQQALYDQLGFNTRPGAIFPDTSCGGGNNADQWAAGLANVLTMRPAVLVCPSDLAGPQRGGVATGSYALVHGQNGPSRGINLRSVKLYNTGMFNYRIALSSREARDGLSNVFYVGEAHGGDTADGSNRWMIARRHADSLRTTDNPLNTKVSEGVVFAYYGPVENGAFRSQHPAGSHFGFGDGRVTFISDSIDLFIYRALSTRNDGSSIGL